MTLTETLRIEKENIQKKEILTDEDKNILELIDKKLATTEEELTKYLTLEELSEILGLTIKRDKTNKIITFLCMLSAYTEDSQFNISFRAPSSTGKSYIPMEIANLFPKEDVKEIAYASPTSFYHDGEWDMENKVLRMDLERKILIFVDQPHDILLQRLRPLLSHDEKELTYKITDKKEKYGLRTKTVIIRGYPSVIFCTSSFRLDEQESTRNILLSPETTQDKLKESVILKIKKMTNEQEFKEWLEKDLRRLILKERIKHIKEIGIKQIVIPQSERILEKFISRKLKPRDSRDAGKLISIIKSLALLNLWRRKNSSNGKIIASDEDVDNGFKLWNEVAKAQELGVSPYILQIYEEVVKPIANDGISRKDILKNYYNVYGRSLPDWQLRQEIIPALETAGLIYQEQDLNDKRKTLIFNTTTPSDST